MTGSLFGQQTSISYELNGRASNEEIHNFPENSKNPFAQFIGEWTLKNDTWIQNWGGSTDTVKIPGHHTVSAQVNTDNSLLSIIDGPEPNGHIFWSHNPNTGKVSHLSSFGEIREGIGSGEFYGENNLRLKVKFEGEGEGTYRIYTYEWVSENEYALKSLQYDSNDKATGLFYQGDFVRVRPARETEKRIKEVLFILDNNEISKEEQLKVYAEEVTHMAPNQEAITNKADLLEYLKQQQTYGYSDMKHKIVEYEDYGNAVVMRGYVEGTFHPSNGGEGIPFRTKNLIVFKKENDALKIAKVIYNMSPVD